MKKTPLCVKAALLLFFLLWSPKEALGQFQDFFGVGAGQSGMGSAGTATSTDSSATYYNPAGLAYGKPLESAVTLEYISLSGFDVSVEKDSAAARDAEDIEGVVGISLGISITFGGGRGQKKDKEDPAIPCEVCGTTVRMSTTKCPVCKAEFEASGPVKDQAPMSVKAPQFAFGFHIFLPFKNLVQASAQDPRVPSLYFYDGNLKKIALFLGGAYRFSDWLALGVGVSLLADASVKVQISQPVGQPVNVDFKESLVGDIAPIAGLRVRPVKKLWLGLTYRGELSLKVDAFAGTDVFGVPAVILKIQSIVLFSPHQVALGGVYEVLPGLKCALDVTWYNWSRFETTANTVENQPGSVPLSTDPPPKINTRDIFVPRLGLEWTFWKKYKARFGYTYYPAIVKEQTGETNILDGDRHIISFGGGYRFKFFGLQHQADFYCLLHYMPERTNKQSDPTDFYGTTSAKGVAFALGFTFKTEF